MDYIDRKLLLADILDAKVINKLESSRTVLKKFEGMVMSQPAADVAEVVRCKDCVFSKKDAIHKVTVVCTRFKTGEFTRRMNPDDFCSHGERSPQKEG